MKVNSQENEIRLKENQLFIDNFTVIKQYKNVILSTPEMFFCEFGSAYFSLIYYWGTRAIPLGALIKLWDDENFKDKCDNCDGEVLILGAGGSPLSGNHSWWGFCTKCGRWCNGKKHSFLSLREPIQELLQDYSDYRNYPVCGIITIMPQK